MMRERRCGTPSNPHAYNRCGGYVANVHGYFIDFSYIKSVSGDAVAQVYKAIFVTFTMSAKPPQNPQRPPNGSQDDGQPQMPPGMPPMTRKGYNFVMCKNYFVTECQKNPDFMTMLERMKALDTVEVYDLVFSDVQRQVDLVSVEDFIAFWLFTGSRIYAKIVSHEDGGRDFEQYLFDDHEHILYKFITQYSADQVSAMDQQMQAEQEAYEAEVAQQQLAMQQQSQQRSPTQQPRTAPAQSVPAKKTNPPVKQTITAGRAPNK